MKIFLIGPMGSGKSKIGKILSDKLDLNLFDIDKEIERQELQTQSWKDQGYPIGEQRVVENQIQL